MLPNAHHSTVSQETLQQLQNHYRDILYLLGEHPEREGLQKTPLRVAKALDFLTQGYRENLGAIINAAKFREKNVRGNLVTVCNIEFFSLCEHHLLPFWGAVHIGYIPDEYIVGLSKLPRIVNALSRRLQVQERLTADIANALQTHLQPQGVGVVIKAQHMCLMMRGVEKKQSVTVSSTYNGKFKEDFYRNDFLRSITL